MDNERIHEEGNYKLAKNTLGNTSLLLSLIGIPTSLILVGLVLEAVALILGIVGLNKDGRKKGTSVAGVIISSVGLIVSVLVILGVFVFFPMQQYAKYDYQTKISSDTMTCECVRMAIDNCLSGDAIVTASDYKPLQSGLLEDAVRDAGPTFEKTFEGIMGRGAQNIKNELKTGNYDIYIEVNENNAVKVYLKGSPDGIYSADPTF